MTARFTLRDFLVYFSSGSFFVLLMDVVYFDLILKIVSDFFKNYEFLDGFATLLGIILVPLVYILGHILHGVGFLSLKVYKEFHEFLNKNRLRRFRLIEWMRIILHFFMYRVKVVNAVIKEINENGTWNNVEHFWEDCARLQIKDDFDSANYWYALNDLFKSIYTASLIASILSFYNDKWILGSILSGLMFLSQYRAVQFGDSFVKTVRRLANVSS
ncbi:hypothetical protein [Poritiphilus flavus]|uniref:Uncharacterized protein n=1 Tax=Poritiphilus flavus TaxID=2697053 RepID=A0A6L9EGP9_9FLAO|nr:hypothetical protein [Poritiphilus flavus]NAS13698.1 hypothetical protein [Poritiphilus flavus]